MQAAFDAVPSEKATIVKLAKDIEMTSKDIATLDAGKTITLDMNEKKIIVQNGFKARPIVNEGTMIVTGNGTIDSSMASEGHGAITNSGSLTIQNGTFAGDLHNRDSSAIECIEGKTIINDGDFTGTCAVDNAVNSELIVNGGKFHTVSASCESGAWSYCFRSGGKLTFNKGEVTGVDGALQIYDGEAEINDGTFKTELCKTHKMDVTHYALYVASKNDVAKATVNGGTFTSVSKYAGVFGETSFDDLKQANVVINGGTYNSGDKDGYVIQSEHALATLQLNGGTFNKKSNIESDTAGNDIIRVLNDSTREKANLDAFITNKKYMGAKNENNNFEIKAVDEVEAAADGTYYITFAKALEDAKDSIKLNKDLSFDMGKDENAAAIKIDKNITLDGNGKTITVEGSTKGVGHVIGISGGVNAAIKNLTIDGSQIAKHGIKVYGKKTAETAETVTTSVTVKNCTGYGFLVNGEMKANRITIADNGEGGVNLQGADVEDQSPKFTFNSGTLQKKNPIQAETVGTQGPTAKWVEFGDNAGTWYATKSVRDGKTLIQWSRELQQGEAKTDGVIYKTFEEALDAAASTGSIVTLMKDIEVDMGTGENKPAILIEKELTLDGNGKTIKAVGSKKDVGHVISVQGHNAKIKNLNINGNDIARNGIQTYGEGKNVTLENVQITNCLGYAAEANGSGIIAEGLITRDNGKGGVKIGKDSGAAADPSFTFKGGDLQKNNPIRIENAGNEEPKAEWVTFGEKAVVGAWQPVTKNEGGKTVIQFVPGEAITGITLNTANMSLVEGNKAQLIATVAPEDAYDTNVTWTAENNEGVITIDDNGLVTAKKEGSARVIATAADGEKTAECAITVTKKQEAVEGPVEVVVEPGVTINEKRETVINESHVMQVISNAKDKESVVVRMPQSVVPVLSKEVFAAANKSSADKLIVEVPKKTGTYAATFEFETAAMDKIVGVNTEIKIKDDGLETSELPNTNAKVGVSLSHKGVFPAPAKIKIAIENQAIKEGDTVYIYYLKPANSYPKPQLIDNGPLTVSEDKTVTFTVRHSSDYIITTGMMEPTVAADSVDGMIGQIGTVTYTDDTYQAIIAARDAYNGFKKQYKEHLNLIEKYPVLENAEKSYKALSDQVKAFKADVDELSKINRVMTYEQQKKAAELEKAYNALSNDQKAALGNYEQMYADVKAVYAASKDAEVVSQANRVSKLVDQLPTKAIYSTSDKKKIDAARNMYNSVVAETPAAKALLDADLKKIQKAENEYKSAKRTAYNIAKISLSTTKYTYNGKAKKPAVKGLSAFVNGTDYTVVYKNNIKTGKATVTVTAKGDCAGLRSKTATFKIIPAKASISKLKNGKKSFKVTIKSQKSAGVSGYQISYSLKKNKKFKSTTTTKTSKTVKKLKSKKTYYVKVRAYKKIDGKKYYGAYSKIKKIKTK